MNQFWKIVSFGVVISLLVDTAAYAFSMGSEGFKLPFWFATLGSALILVMVGYFGYKKVGLARTFGAATLIDVIDAMLWWAFSWLAGLGPPRIDQISIPGLVKVVIFYFIFLVICVLIGSAIVRVTGGLHREENGLHDGQS